MGNISQIPSQGSIAYPTGPTSTQKRENITRNDPLATANVNVDKLATTTESIAVGTGIAESTTKQQALNQLVLQNTGSAPKVDSDTGVQRDLGTTAIKSAIGTTSTEGTPPMEIGAREDA
jgi:hypothetical protein